MKLCLNKNFKLVLSVMMTMALIFSVFSASAYATKNSRTLKLSQSRGTLTVYASIQSHADSDGGGVYNAKASLTTKKSIKNSKISITCDFYINGISANVNLKHVGVGVDGPKVSKRGYTWTKKEKKTVSTPEGARVYGRGLWWYLGYYAYADLHAWGDDFQTSVKI